MTWRNSLEAKHARLERQIAPPAPPPSAIPPDLKHCLAVIRANGGRGFPHFTAARDELGANNPGSVAL